MRVWFWIWALLVGLMLAAASWPAFAQGFTVKPMLMQVNPAPSQTVEVPLQIFNTATDGPRTIELRLVDLTQDDEGAWRLVESGSKDNPTGAASSLAWTALSANSVSIGPQQPASINVRLHPPVNARGFYFAGIVAETPIPTNPVGVVVRVRFLIPLIIEIKGRTVRQRINVSGISMLYKTDTGATPTTIAEMDIGNAGQTFSRVRGQVTVERQNGALWRVVTRLPISERSIMPGMTLKLPADLKRRLPSGPYRLRAELFVDGRQVTPMQKVIQFAGDPNATVAYDATLTLAPSVVDMKVVPGATRTTILSIENTSTDPVSVDLASTTPRGLVGVQMGKLVGSALSAQPWTTIQPTAFMLRPGGRENVRVISTVPSDGVSYPNYYADLTLNGTYPNGQSAGETFSTIRLVNMSVHSVPDGQIEGVSLAESSDAKFVAQLQFDNVGNVDYEPTAQLMLFSSAGEVLASQNLSGDPGPLLPLGKRVFSGEMDLSALKPGQYLLQAVVTIDKDKQVSRKFVMTVSAGEADDDAKTPAVPNVTLSDSDASAPDARVALAPGKQQPLDQQGDTQ